MDERFRQLDARMRLRLEQRKNLARRLERLLVAPRPELLARDEEQAFGARLDALEAALPAGDAGEPLRTRSERLRGLLLYTLHLEYAERLTEAHRHLRELAGDVEDMTERYGSFVRTRQAATHSFVGYGGRIEDLRGRIAAASKRLGTLMEAQGRKLESVAIEELVARRELLETYQDRARFAFADSYDRAAKARAQARVQ
jgi:hypothetical protein